MNRRTALTFPARTIVLAALACALLAGCGGAKKDDAKAQAAGGQVLPGTVSDAMIDLDGSQAQAPLVDPGAAAAQAGSSPGLAATSDDSAPDPVIPVAKSRPVVAPTSAPDTSATAAAKAATTSAAKPAPKPSPKAVAKPAAKAAKPDGE
ncbi:hypothetical protein [Novosphingobium lentum]|uniref:hypothetical protein n=1 Tax=Novosphingobium lentum TaxID=145287 RepID=UPI000832E5B8|nr:hypothetical protein [Novosphingobium lentum]